MNSDFENRIELLIAKLRAINNPGIHSKDFTGYVNTLKSEANELIRIADNSEIRQQLENLANFRAFDELSWITRFLRKMTISKFRLDFQNNWKTSGKYLSDLHDIELTLKGISYKLQK